MPLSPINPHAFNFANALAPFAQGDGLPLAGLLNADSVARLADEHHVQFGQSARAFWTPALTLWAFLWQVLGADGSCRQSVAQVVLAVSLTRQPEELDTAAYCRARAKLPAAFLQELSLQLGQGLEAVALPAWQWHGRRVSLLDGSTSRLPDTPENQQAFPQPRTQKPGLGFPIIRWVVLIGLATAALQGFAYGRYLGKETGETALFRELLQHLAAGDLVVADRYYCSYFLIALLQQRGVDVVFRLHPRRRYDFRRGQRLGPDDHVVVWHKPARPEWMDEAEYAALPATLRIREIRYKVNEPGCRVAELVVATTLLDAEECPSASVADLYQQRWHVELDIRNLKCTLGLDDLRCLTPFMIAKEMWAKCLAYNLVRQVAAQAAALAEVTPREVSFKATKQALLGSWQKLTLATAAEYVAEALTLLRVLRKQRVGNRPGRCEPRALKRRPKPHDLLQEPRALARAKLRRGKGRRRRRRGRKSKRTQ